MTAHHIAFATSSTDGQLIEQLHANSAGCRVPLQVLQKQAEATVRRQSLKLWIDPGIDGLNSAKILDPQDKTNPTYRQFIQQFPFYDRIADPQFQRRPDKSKVGEFVSAVLNAALSVATNVGWISVPQLPYVGTSDRNRINAQLAEATLDWKAKSRYRGKLMLPVVLAKSGLTDRKTDRNPSVKLANTCYQASGANGIWVADATLDDQDGATKLETVRFPGIIKFHEELNTCLANDTVTVAGPYWALNVVLWARGLVKFPAVGIGRSYQYYISGGFQMEATPKVPLGPLRRLVVWSPELRGWLGDALKRLSRDDPAYSEFAVLQKDLPHFADKEYSRQRVASYYAHWISKFDLVLPDSRALTLYQDFSAAYVLGMKLKPIPGQKLKNPARIAKQMMVNCL